MPVLNYADTFRIGGATPSAVYLGATKVWPGFKPTDISGCAVWMDATKLNLSQGATVSTWTNLGSGSQPTITGTPTFQTNALNGRPVVRINQGAGKFRWYSGTSVDLNWTLVYIGRRWQLSAGRVVTAFTTASNLLVGFHNTEMDQCYIEGWLTSGTYPTATTAWKLYSADSTSTTQAQFYINGVMHGYSPGSVTPAKGWGGTLCISGYTDDAAVATSQECDCEIAELVMYNRKITVTERINVENYLRTKWLRPVPFKPTDLGANLIGWFDGADTATVQIVGSGVNNWVNKGVSAMTITQGTDAYRPTYASQTVTIGNPQVFMVANSPANFDAIWVGRPRPAAGNDWRTLFRNNTSGLHHVIIENGSTRFGVYNAGFFQAGAPGFTWDNVWGIGYGSWSASAAPALSRDGSAVYPTSTTAPAANISLDTFGAYSGPPPSQGWGDIHEVIFLPYSYQISARQMLEGYLAWKWGLTQNIGGNNPYSTTPPMTLT